MAKTIQEAWKEERSNYASASGVRDKNSKVKALKAEFRNRFQKEQAMKHSAIEGWKAAKDSKDKYKRYII